MGLFNVIGSLQNLESAEAAGDRYETMPCLLLDAPETVVSALFGNPFPTTIYIGHPAWKAMGARRGYSILNGTVIAILCFLGAVPLLLRFVPLDVTLGILLTMLTVIHGTEGGAEVPREHAPAVALGLIPSLAAWLLVQIETTLRAAGSSLCGAAPAFGSDLPIRSARPPAEEGSFARLGGRTAVVFAIEYASPRACAGSRPQRFRWSGSSTPTI